MARKLLFVVIFVLQWGVVPSLHAMPGESRSLGACFLAWGKGMLGLRPESDYEIENLLTGPLKVPKKTLQRLRYKVANESGGGLPVVRLKAAIQSECIEVGTEIIPGYAQPVRVFRDRTPTEKRFRAIDSTEFSFRLSLEQIEKPIFGPNGIKSTLDENATFEAARKELRSAEENQDPSAAARAVLKSFGARIEVALKMMADMSYIQTEAKQAYVEKAREIWRGLVFSLGSEGETPPNPFVDLPR